MFFLHTWKMFCLCDNDKIKLGKINEWKSSKSWVLTSCKLCFSSRDHDINLSRVHQASPEEAETKIDSSRIFFFCKIVYVGDEINWRKLPDGVYEFERIFAKKTIQNRKRYLFHTSVYHSEANQGTEWNIFHHVIGFPKKYKKRYSGDWISGIEGPK